MRRLRESWLAFGGAALIVALSITSALGADPTFRPTDTIGEQVSEFARALNGQNDDADQPDADEQADDDGDATDEDGTEAEDDATDGDADAETEEAPEIGEEGFDWTTVSHGECVSWHAHQDENADTDDEATDADDESDEAPQPGEDGYEWRNHGEYVSYWARIGCYEEPEDQDADEDACEDEAVDTDEANPGDDQEATDEEACEDPDEDACDDEAADSDEATNEEACEDPDEEADEEPELGEEGFDWTTVSHGQCVSWHAHQDETSPEMAPEDGEEWKNHGEFVSYWAREGCRTAPDEGDEADETDEDEAEAAAAEAAAAEEKAKADKKPKQNNGNGNGNGGNGRGNGGGGRGGRP